MLDTTANPAALLPQQAVAHSRFAPTPSGSRHAGPRWFVVSTHPQAERRAAHHLAQQGYDIFLPFYVTRRRDPVIRSMFHTVQVPLFARYCFVRFDPHRDPWRPILSTPGVYDLLRNRGTSMPEPVRAGAVEALEATQDARRSLPPPNAMWRPGAPCRVSEGIFQGHQGVVIAIADLVLVSLMFLGHLREIPLPPSCLEPRHAL